MVGWFWTKWCHTYFFHWSVGRSTFSCLFSTWNDFPWCLHRQWMVDPTELRLLAPCTFHKNLGKSATGVDWFRNKLCRTCPFHRSLGRSVFACVFSIGTSLAWYRHIPCRRWMVHPMADRCICRKNLGKCATRVCRFWTKLARTYPFH